MNSRFRRNGSSDNLLSLPKSLKSEVSGFAPEERWRLRTSAASAEMWRKRKLLGGKTRKDLRKEKKQMKKKRKIDHLERRKRVKKFGKTEEKEIISEGNDDVAVDAFESNSEEENNDSNSFVGDVADPFAEEIASLEEKLGLSGSKNKSALENLMKEFEEDGLGDLFRFSDRLHKGDKSVLLERDSNEEQETDELEDIKSSEDDEEDEEMESDHEEVSGPKALQNGSVEYDNEAPEDDSEVKSPTAEELEQLRKQYQKKSEMRKEKQRDLYGSREEISTETGKYVPPAIRKRLLEQTNASSLETEKILQLRKIITGLLNRLSESSLPKISNEIASIYGDNSSNEVTDIIANVLLEFCQDTQSIGTAAILSSLLMCSSALMEFLYLKFGPMVGGMFIEKFVDAFSTFLGLGDSQQLDIFPLKNIVIILSHIYSFGLFHSKIVYDILGMLLKPKGSSDAIEEYQVELIVIILQNCGYKLRKEDPVGFKNFLLSISHIPKSSFKGSESRISFLLETVDDLKNNKQKLSDRASLIRPIQKWLSSLSSSYESSGLRVSLEDIVDREKKGRWWLTGAAWQGRSDSESQSTTENSFEEYNSSDANLNLLKLAKKQRMSTETRKRVFCVVMGAQDYMDAFEKILQLDLRGNEHREIVRVIIECCGKEKCFNPYYFHLLEKLSSFDRSHKFTLQLYFWDMIKMVDTLENKVIGNYAKLLAKLIGSFCLSLSCLKVVDFASSSSNQNLVLFLHVLFKHLLLDTSSSSQLAAVFQRIAGSNEDLRHLRNGIQYFIRRHVLPYYRQDHPEECVIHERFSIASKSMAK